MEKERMASNLF